MSRYYPTTQQLTDELPTLVQRANELEKLVADAKLNKESLKSVREDIRAILHGPKQTRKPRAAKGTTRKAKPKATSELPEVRGPQ